VTLTFCWDLSGADWIVHSDLPWQQLVGFGPAGFDTYARLRFLPDPVRPGQSENDVQADWRTDQLPALFEVLATHTATPDDCYFCVWEGFGHAEVATDDYAVYIDDENAGAQQGQAGAQPGWAPVALPSISPSTPQPPKVVVPNRAYWLFRGSLADVGRWDTAHARPGQCRLDEAEPAFIWPADHTWCLARDVDPHWAGIGGTPPLITRLMTEPRLDVVPADPTTDQPLYR
jgi:hypothetical protein